VAPTLTGAFLDGATPPLPSLRFGGASVFLDATGAVVFLPGAAAAAADGAVFTSAAGVVPAFP